MNLTSLLAQARSRLAAAPLSYGHGTTNANDEAAWLTLWALGLPLDSDLHALGSQEVSEADTQRVLGWVQQRIDTRKPTAYLTRQAWLAGVPFYVDERAIVPRSFIAELIAQGGFDAWLSPHTHQVLDLCTGNGSLAVLAALAWPELQVTGADISAQALEVAQINVTQHQLSDRIRLVQSDGLRQCPGPWDLIICNPPYVNAQSMATLPAEYRAEPELALAGGNDGMDFVRRLLREAPSVLNPGGVLVLEIGNERAHFEAAFAHLSVVWLECSAGCDQVVLITQDAMQLS